MSATFTVTQNDVITLAARRLGILELGGTLDSATQAEGVMLLNLLLKQHPADLGQIFSELQDKDREAAFSLLAERNGRLAMEAIAELGQIGRAHV